MSWSFSIPETPAEDFDAAVEAALTKANIAGQNKDGVESAKLAADTLKTLAKDWPPAREANAFRGYASGHNNPQESRRTDDTFHISIERVK